MDKLGYVEDLGMWVTSVETELHPTQDISKDIHKQQDIDTGEDQDLRE